MHVCLSEMVFNAAEVYAAVARSERAVMAMCPWPPLCLQKLGNINPASLIGQYEGLTFLPYCFVPQSCCLQVSGAVDIVPCTWESETGLSVLELSNQSEHHVASVLQGKPSLSSTAHVQVS